MRSRARDYYDLWRILGASRNRLDASGFESFLREKCTLKEVTFSGPEALRYLWELRSVFGGKD